MLQKNCLLGHSTVPIKPLESKDKNGYWLTEISHRVVGGLIERDRDREEGISGIKKNVEC